MTQVADRAAWFMLVSYSAYYFRRNCTSETSVDFQRTTRNYIPEDRNPHNQRYDRLRVKYAFLGTTERAYIVPTVTDPPEGGPRGRMHSIHSTRSIDTLPWVCSLLNTAITCILVHRKTGFLLFVFGMKERVSSRQRHFGSDGQADRQTCGWNSQTCRIFFFFYFKFSNLQST
jgi:hypothetical protein